jgi:hypothetical protein
MVTALSATVDGSCRKAASRAPIVLPDSHASLRMR